jgi:hypothetical protein
MTNLTRAQHVRSQSYYSNKYLLIIFFSPLLLWCIGYIVAFPQVLTVYPIYHTWIHLLNHSPSSPFPEIPGVVSIGIIFAFIYMCTYFLHSIHPTTLFPNTFFLSLVPAPPLVRTCSTFLFSDFVKEKREKETNKQTNLTF